MSSSPPFQRLAITAPPDDWFHGIARSMFELYRGGLAALGCEIREVPVEWFVVPDAGRIANLLEELREFRPQAAFGLPKGAYALICRLPGGQGKWRPNLFTDVLDIPTICLWDHAPLELADQLLYPHPADPSESAAGAMERLAQALAHPRLIHWSPDTYQTGLMQRLGLAGPNPVIQESLPSLPGFAPHADAQSAPGAAFVGHFYQGVAKYPDPLLSRLADDFIGRWLAAANEPAWDVLAECAGALDPKVRKRLAMDLDQTYFWHFAHELTLNRAQTERRLRALGKAAVPVTCYGNLRTDAGGVPANLSSVPAQIPFGPELARLLSRHEITIDVHSPGSTHGYSHKPLLAFASGGFMLVDRKRDFIQAFGDAGAAVSYANDLDAKVERFLANPDYRRETGDEIRETIRERFQLMDVLLRVLETARLYAKADSPATQRAQARQSTVVKDLLAQLRTRWYWRGASVRREECRVAIQAPPRAWQCCAEIPISPDRNLREPHLRVGLRVEYGRFGIALVKGRRVEDERFVSATSDPVTVTMELPRSTRTKVVFRNAVESASRAAVMEASLCDR